MSLEAVVRIGVSWLGVAVVGWSEGLYVLTTRELHLHVRFLLGLKVIFCKYVIGSLSLKYPFRGKSQKQSRTK